MYGISETLGEGEQLIHGVNYYLDYRTSETSEFRINTEDVANYCLDYCTSEIPVPTDALPARVNYCLIYGTSETRAVVLCPLN